MIKLTWKNSCTLGGIYYGGTYENKMFIDAPVVRPEYVNIEEGFENDNAVFVKEYESLKKIYKFEFMAPEYVADSLKLMALHDDIKITYVNGLYQSQIRNVKVNVNPDEAFNDCMFLIEVTFEQDDQVIRTACCD